MRALVWAALFCFSPLWAAKPIPPPPVSYVYNEGVISENAAAELSARLKETEARSRHQFAAALFQSLEGESLEDYSHRLFKAWGVGSRARNDGVLFCLFLQERRWRVEVGYGLEGTITDLEAAELARMGVPYFKKGDFDAGVLAAAGAISAKLMGGPLPAQGGEGGIPPALLLLTVLVLVLAPLLLILAPRGRRGVTWDSWGSGGSWGGGGGLGGFSGGGGLSGGGGASGGW